MEEISDNIEMFVSNLQRNMPTNRPPAASIYRDTVIHTPCNVKVKDVISEVSKQMKDIHNADCATGYKKPSMPVNKYKKSTFVSVNELSALEETSKKAAQTVAGTQLVLDTQLMNVMQDAEGLATAGLTQEFQSTFPYPGPEKEGEISNKNPEFPILDISLKGPEPNEFHDRTSKLEPANIHTEKAVSENKYDDPENIQNRNDEEEAEFVSENIIFVDNNDLSIEFGTVKDINDSKHEVILIRENSSEIVKTDTEVDSAQILSETVDVETNDKDIFLPDSDINMPSSPVLSVKMSRKSSTSSTIVIDLETFEKFEELASPLLMNVNNEIDFLEQQKDLLKSIVMVSPRINEKEQIHVNDSPKRNEKEQKNDFMPSDIKEQINNVSDKINEKEQEYDDIKSQSILEPMNCESTTNIIEQSESKHIIPEEILAGSNINDNYRNVSLLEKTKVIEIDTKNSINPIKIDQKSNETNTLQEALHSLGNTERYFTIDKQDTSKELLNDEILFSSDEEEEYINMYKNNQIGTCKKYQDLPLTCVLETSFYDNQPDVLDKTMYVGFQTASNKSIKVLTNSFCRAKSFLSEDLDPGNEKTVTELVDMCSTTQGYYKEFVNAKDKENNTNNVLKNDKNVSCVSQVKDLLEIDTIFENKLEEIKERITNTISSDVFVTCDDKSSATESPEILIPEKLDKALDMLNKHDSFDLLAVKTKISLNDRNLHSTKNELDTDNDQNINARDFSPKYTETCNKEYFEAGSQIISFSQGKDTVTDIDTEFVPMSQVLITTKNKENNTCTTKINIVDTESNHTKTNTFTANPIAEKLNNEKKVVNMSKITVKCGKEIDNSFKNKTDAIPIETDKEFDTGSFPSSQIISLKSIKPSQKRKNDFLETKNKRVKLSKKDEIHDEKVTDLTKKGEIQIKNEFEDIDFDTCDFREILIQENLKKHIDYDQVNSKIIENKSEVVKIKSSVDKSSSSAVVKRESTIDEKDDLDFDIRELLIQENLNTFLSNKTDLKKETHQQNASKIENVNISLNITKIVNTDTDINNAQAKNLNIDTNVEDVFVSNVDKNDLPEHCKNITQTGELKNIETILKLNKNTEESCKVLKSASSEIIDIQLGGNETNLIKNIKLSKYTKKSPKNSQNIETMSENSEEPPFIGFSNVEDKIKALEEIAKCKKLFENYNFDQSIFEQNYLEKVCGEEDSNLKTVEPEKLRHMSTKTELESNFKMKLENKNNEAKLETTHNLKESKPKNQKSMASDSNRNVSINVEVEGSETRNYKQVKMSEEALTKLEYYFKDMDKFPVQKVSNIHENVPVFQGFKTASKKPIKISEMALAKSRKLFQEIDTKDLEIKRKICNEKVTHTILERQNFKSPCNKPIKISSSALEKTKKMFQNLDYNFCELNRPNIHELKSSLPVYKTPDKKTIYDSKYSSTKKDLDEISTTSIDSCSERSLFLGLNRGSNKPIQVTPKSFRTKKILESAFYNDDEDCDGLDSNPVNVLEGFTTASHKEIKISEKARENSTVLFQDICSKDQELPVENFGTLVIPKTNNSFQGFKTASNKLINISVKALEKGRKLFQDIDTKYLEVSTKNSNTVFKGFQTASNKKVELSKSALEESRKIMQKFDDMNLKYSHNIDRKILEKPDNLNNEIKNDDFQKSTLFQGFKTASNKQVKISEKALIKGRQLFKDIDAKCDKQIDLNNQLEKEEIPNTSAFQGFKTASNKQVKISEKALMKSRQLFQNIHTENFEIPADSNNQMDVSKTTIFPGLKTASNKEIKISEKALAKSRKLFHDIDTKIFEEPDYLNKQIEKGDIPKTTVFQGFKTASNKLVKVSEEALIKGKQLFQDNNTKESEMPDHLKVQMNAISKTTAFQGFMTGNKKNVTVSKEALEQSRTLLHTINSANKNNHTNRDKEEICLENTGNDKIIVNEDTLIKSRILSSGSEDKKLNTTNISIENVINTQVLINFEDTLHTEDFFKEYPKSEAEIVSTPKSTKRPGSPILSVPKAKKKKRFEIPYSQKVVEAKNIVEDPINKPEATTVTFNETYKKSKVYTLKDLQNIENNDTSSENNPSSYILNFDIENLLEFEFIDEKNDLILDQPMNPLKIQDLINIFEASVNSKLIPKGWTENHVKLILWKLISYEIKFPKTMKNTCTAKNVIEQLKYRYDKELFNAERPVLRKILEKDDVSGKTMILCVVAFFVDGVLSTTSITSSKTLELLLTDGWYTIRCTIDKMLTSLVHRGKIKVGTKIATCGAELIGDEQGVSPWEDTSAIRLKLHGNSTRPARWDARLGCHGNAAILSQLTAVRPDGGKVSKLRCAVTRVYPALYVDKFTDGSTVTRSERLEHLHQMKYESERQAIMEKLYEDVEKELANQDSEDSPEVTSSRHLESGSQIARKMKMSKDPQEFRASLTSTQRDLLAEYEMRKRDSYIQSVQTLVQERIERQGLHLQRNAVRLLKVRVVGVSETNGRVDVAKAMLSIWKPCEALLEILTEGAWVDVMNVTSTAFRYSELQISAGRQSVFNPSKYIQPEHHKPYLSPYKRKCYTIKDLCKTTNMTTEYNEIDTVGVLVEIDPEMTKFDSKKQQFQNVYLSDVEKNIVCVNFWGGVNKFGFESILDTGQVISCTNLQKRAGNTRKCIPQYRATEFSYFTKTPKSIEARKIVEDLTKSMNGIDKKKFCEDCRSLRSNFVANRLQSNSENVTPYRFTNIDINSTKNKVFIDTPLAQRSTKTDENLNLTGLDFESTFQQVDTQEMSPRTLLRKRQVKERIEKLKRCGEPPPLSPITILNKSKNAAKAFKSPLISKSDSSACVASDEIIVPNQDNCETCVPTSPILGMNRTYVKRNVNPVKLNFSKNNEDTFDHFAEDFDGSPPLSLE